MRGESTLNIEYSADEKKKKKRLRRILSTLKIKFNLVGRRILIRNPE
jgi:uncharacterized protein YlxP (DUF503 family)